MAFKLDGRYPTIASPWGDYAVYSFPDASKIGCSDRQPIMDAMNSIIAINWKAIEPHWTASSSPFDSKYSLILVYDRVELIAFSVYRVMTIAHRMAIYRSGTEVLPAYQGRGLYGFFTSQILKHPCAASHSERLLYGWRTRNPIVWAANAKICEMVAPSLLADEADADLQAACIEMCATLYPGKPLEVPGMIMRGAYGHIEHIRQDYRGTASLVEAAMSRIIPNSADALFSVGYARV
ncbi:MAG: hypothetical protein EKK32_13765 [Bradyrhizobiaceae bacterium]|jgi:hypothetical protein|uniref:N-acetyltransferase domain-containing protein n=2 Tax=Bradyrhizobium TaxID=374 RepID=A0ABS5G7J1_9BRAD|nr:hypothetical protein BBta_5820 [Bradyrhizobium sp. BTAi1]MBR1137228.1 hypothetical protein [Bradyrhizobium denitrificans]NPU25086.1 hypothetical protein [Bradyrhizobium sp. LMG 8443]RTM01247.1 MAG: hypothetical protein EKK32_13765 [Bradyrhizobiaceae bacterium]